MRKSKLNNCAFSFTPISSPMGPIDQARRARQDCRVGVSGEVELAELFSKIFSVVMCLGLHQLYQFAFGLDIIVHGKQEILQLHLLSVEFGRKIEFEGFSSAFFLLKLS